MQNTSKPCYTVTWCRRPFLGHLKNFFTFVIKEVLLLLLLSCLCCPEPYYRRSINIVTLRSLSPHSSAAFVCIFSKSQWFQLPTTKNSSATEVSGLTPLTPLTLSPDHLKALDSFSNEPGQYMLILDDLCGCVDRCLKSANECDAAVFVRA